MTKRGFTLVELLIVMAILAILATLGISNFRTARIKARDLSRKSDLQTIAKSLEAYVNDHRSYPSNTMDGYIDCSPTSCPWGSPFSDGKSTYAATLPADPSDPSNSYSYSSDNVSYTLYARLENLEDPAIVSGLGVDCGILECNYKIVSSNIQ